MTELNEEQFTETVERVKNALAGAGATTGATMLPTETADEIIEIVYERNFMRSIFPSMPMSTRTINVPSLTGSISFHEQTLADTEAGTAQAESRPATSEITMTLKTMIANVPIGNYLIAYGVEGLLAVIRDDIAQRLAHNEQALMLNGDTQAVAANNINNAYHAANNPGGVGAANNDYLFMFDGLRKLAGKSVTVAGAFAATNLASAIKELGVYAEDRSALCMIVSRNLEVQLLGLSQLQTVDKYGPSATIVTGEVGKIYGVRVFATSVMPDNLGATGVVPAAFNGTKTMALLLHMRSPLIGNPTVADRRFSIDFHDEPTKDRFVLIPKQDIAFSVRYADAVCKILDLTTV